MGRLYAMVRYRPHIDITLPCHGPFQDGRWRFEGGWVCRCPAFLARFVCSTTELCSLLRRDIRGLQTVFTSQGSFALSALDESALAR